MAVTTRSFASTYHVFLSFRGEDTRYGFTGNLYKALSDKGIHTFIDDEKLQRGEEITPALLNAIEESRIAITVLSEEYASSSFCLEELATILDCAQNRGLLVIPVFYKVDPSDVRHLKGTYAKALAKHEKRFPEKLQKWKTALCKVANLSGYHLKDGVGYEYKFIEKIVEKVSSKINCACCLHVAEYPVGLESGVLEVRKLLDDRYDGVHMIGIHGMGGVGKSTLARAVYNDLIIAENFDGLCFLENVREKSKHGLQHLQSILLSKILGEKDINFSCWEEGASMIPLKLHQKKVLLVLDDVDKHKQLLAIAGGRDWFGPSSRIIITTRDKQLLDYHKVPTYEVKKLNKNDALQLLTSKVFKTGKADPMYEGVLHHVVTYASGLPLALEVIGSNLFGKSVAEWELAIEHYKRVPHNQIQDILQVSFDALQDEEKSVFLDIACCFKGYALTEVEDILCAHYGHNMKHHIGVLVEKSLMKLDYYGDYRVTLHDLIEDMGKEIVWRESPANPEEHSRLWSWEDIVEVLEENTGTSKIKMICLDFPKFSKEIVEWDGKAFMKMQKLETLIIKNAKFSEGPKCLPNSLRVLEWWGYPSHCLPSDFQPKKLAICKLLPYSNVLSFKLDDLSKKFVNLTILNFDWCKYLTHIPDVSGSPNLVELSFESCHNLVTVHESIGYLDKLKQLSAFGCVKLESFPSIHLTSLEKLELSRCSSLECFPEILGKMENIRKLHLYFTPIKVLPFSFQYLIGLQDLYLRDCGTVQFPSSIAMMPKLTSIQALRLKGWKWIKQEKDEENVDSIVSSKVVGLLVSGCNLNDDFFSIGFMRFAGVQYLNLSENNFTSLPECIKEFHSLKRLSVSNCKHLLEIRGVPPSLTHFFAKNCTSLTSTSTTMLINKGLHVAQIFHFCLAGAWIPKWIGHQRKGPSCSFWFRNKFPAKILCLLITPVKVKAKLGRYAVHPPMVFINGIVRKSFFDPYTSKVSMLELDHTYLFNLQYKIYFSYDMLQVPWKNKWNHVEITYEGVLESSLVKTTGIHVFKQENGKEEDIRFDDPCSNTKVDYHPNSSESRNQQLKSIDVPSSSSSFNNDVFLCFRGEDTCYSFTGNLCRALRDSGIRTFIDDEELQRGDKITSALKKAIEDSRFFIIVLSQNYASSSFCLNVLAYILECVKRKGLLVLPVFYKVDPSNVGHHRGSFGEALANHEKKFKAKTEELEHNMEKLEQWKMALHETAKLSGYHFKQGDGYEYEFIMSIVELVSSKINRAPIHVADYSVGLESYSDAFSYDVFLSCRGSDTLHGFTGYLYKALHDSGIHTFIDEELQRGEEITPAILKAIQESRIAITVLSINYASSSFCLDELATILDCLKRKRLLVLPVFYNLDPSQVGLQKGSYGEALAKHEERFKHNIEKLEKWKMALHQVANLSSFHVKHGAGYEYEFIGEIVEWVSSKINPGHYPVGLGSKVLEVRNRLDVGCDDGVHMLGIHGIDGVGKSTLAREVYNNLIADHFDASCFIENVREKSKKHGLQHLQSILLSKILGEKDINLTSAQQEISMMQRGRLQQKKVLLVLDDVDRPEQLQAVVAKPAWFGPGSRVIITTRDEQLLTSHDVKPYEVKELNKDDALQFLKWKAFKMHYFDPRYEELLNRAVTYASSLPLALEILGSNLFRKSVEEWKSSIDQFERSPNNPIQTIFKASFDSLEEKERSVFLDIACCYKGYELAEVQDILRAHYGHCMKYYIDVLVDKSLVKISHGTKPCYDTITLHDLIENMAKEIVQQESLTKPGERRRLWLLEDVRKVLGNNKHHQGTSKIEIICLDFPIFDEEEMVEWDGKAFQNMQNLKTVIIRNGNFSKGPDYLPNSLRVLEWWRYPSHCLPSDFHPKELAICKLPCSSISTIELTNLLKKFVNVRVLKFSSANV